MRGSAHSRLPVVGSQTQAAHQRTRTLASRFGMVWSDPEQTAALFIGVQDETLSFAMRVSNPDRAPARTRPLAALRLYSSQDQVAASAVAASGKTRNT